MPNYTKKPITLEAFQLKYKTTITTDTGVQKGDIGDYFVATNDEQYIVSKEQFELTHEIVSTPDTVVPMEISNLLIGDITETTVEFEYETPKDVDFEKVNVYIDSVLTTSIDTKGNVTVLSETLTPNTTYTFTFKTVDIAGNESAGISKTVTTLDVIPTP